jgi:hypothetical protein
MTIYFWEVELITLKIMKIHSLKNWLFIGLVTIIPSVLVAQEEQKDPAQNEHPTEKEKADKDDKIEKLKIAFITTELNLTVEEAQKFWPIYNELENKLKELRKTFRTTEKEIKTDFEKMTNEEAKKKMAELFANEEKEIALRKEYSEKFSKVIGEKRALKLLSLEHEFKRELLEALREQGPHGPPSGPPPAHPKQKPNGGRP